MVQVVVAVRWGTIIFLTGITLILYYMYWVDMWLHLVVGGGFANMYTTVSFWGAQVLLEAVYMHHLSLFLVGIALTLIGGYLTPAVKPKNIVSIALGSVLYVNGLWFFVWQLLELGLTPELYRLLVEWWGGLYYAWGYHPTLPVMYWDRVVCLAVSLLFVLFGFVMLAYPFAPRAGICLFAVLYGLMTLASNLRLDPVYLAGGFAAVLGGFAVLTRFSPKLLLVGLLCTAAAVSAFYPALSPSVLSCHEGVFGGQPAFFACEHLPDGWMVVPSAEVVCVNLKTGQILEVGEQTVLWGGDWWIVSSMPFCLQRV